MRQESLTCIGCPLGCALEVTVHDDGTMDVRGNTCPNGDSYARTELTAPKRVVTSTVRVAGGIAPLVPVKTAAGIPKEKIFACVRAMGAVELTAPVAIGDVVIPDVLGTGVDVIATKGVTKA